MKEFDIEKAKNGAAVCLRDGTPVKILDFDCNGKILYKKKKELSNGKILDDLGWATTEGIGLEKKDLDLFGIDKSKSLYMAHVYGYMNMYKNETQKVLFGGFFRATLEECKEAGKLAHIENLKWFCHARVELLEEEEGGKE